MAFDLGPPTEEGAELLAITLTAGKLTQKIERGLRTVSAPLILVPLPAHYDTGMCVRGGQETNDFGATLGHVVPRSATCGEVSKDAIFMHPPYQGAVGYSFAMYDAVTLPKDPPAAFRAVVGKGDGSDLGDGILYKLAVVDASGAKTIVAEKTVLQHEWLPIEADLSKWAGQKVRLELISDAGTQDNSSGDREEGGGRDGWRGRERGVKGFWIGCRVLRGERLLSSFSHIAQPVAENLGVGQFARPLDDLMPSPGANLETPW